MRARVLWVPAALLSSESVWFSLESIQTRTPPAHGMCKGTRGSRSSAKVTAKFSIFGTHLQLQNSFVAQALIESPFLPQQVPSDRSSPLPPSPPTSFQNSLGTTRQNSFLLLLPIPPRPWLKASSAVRIRVHDPSPRDSRFLLTFVYVYSGTDSFQVRQTPLVPRPPKGSALLQDSPRCDTHNSTSPSPHPPRRSCSGPVPQGTQGTQASAKGTASGRFRKSVPAVSTPGSLSPRRPRFEIGPVRCDGATFYPPHYHQQRQPRRPRNDRCRRIPVTPRG